MKTQFECFAAVFPSRCVISPLLCCFKCQVLETTQHQTLAIGNDEPPPQKNVNPLLAVNFHIGRCANIKLWRPRPKPTIIPHAQTRPKTDFTGLCLTIPRLEGTRLFIGLICVWNQLRYRCLEGVLNAQPKVQGQNGENNEKVICLSSSPSPQRAHWFPPHSLSSCRQSCSLRQRPRGERAIITSTMSLSHRLKPGMPSHELCQLPTVKDTDAAHE